MVTAQVLAHALSQVPPRDATLLSRRFLENRTDAELAALWGIDVERGRALVNDALLHLSAVAAQPSAELALELVEQREAIRKALDDAAIAAEQSPRTKVLEILRWVIIVAVLAYSYDLYRRGELFSQPDTAPRKR